LSRDFFAISKIFKSTRTVKLTKFSFFAPGFACVPTHTCVRGDFIEMSRRLGKDRDPCERGCDPK